jgi:Hint domain
LLRPYCHRCPWTSCPWVFHAYFKKDAESSWPTALLPVRVSRFALDEHTPHRDLYVSPNHALLLDGVLIPAIYLVNGSSIVQAMPEGVEEIEYFHVELEIHEVIFAEGAAVETLLDE